MLQENIVALSEGTQLNQSPAMALDGKRDNQPINSLQHGDGCCKCSGLKSASL